MQRLEARRLALQRAQVHAQVKLDLVVVRLDVAAHAVKVVVVLRVLLMRELVHDHQTQKRGGRGAKQARDAHFARLD